MYKCKINISMVDIHCGICDPEGRIASFSGALSSMRFYRGLKNCSIPPDNREIS